MGSDDAPRTAAARRFLRLRARRAGLEPVLDSTYLLVVRALERPSVRRNRRDDEGLRLLAAALLEERSCCIDVGANEGRLTEVFATLAPKGRHIAYEPVPALGRALARRLPQVEVRQAAVADRPGESTFVVHKRLPSRSSLRPVGYRPEETESIQVQVECLDESLPAEYAPRLIKIDVEGAEHLVLRGARRTLRAHRPVVVFEHQRSTARYYSARPEEIHRLLVEECDMRIFDMDGAGPYSSADLKKAYERGSRWNFFAAPSGSRSNGVSPRA